MPAGYLTTKDFLNMAMKLYHYGCAVKGGILLHQGIMGEDGFPLQFSLVDDEAKNATRLQKEKDEQKKAFTPLELTQIAMKTAMEQSPESWSQRQPDGALYKKIQFQGDPVDFQGKTSLCIYTIEITAAPEGEPMVGGGQKYHYQLSYEARIKEVNSEEGTLEVGQVKQTYTSPILNMDRCYDENGKFSCTLIPTKAEMISHQEKINVVEQSRSRVAMPASFIEFSDRIIREIIALIPDDAEFMELKEILVGRNGVDFFKFIKDKDKKSQVIKDFLDLKLRPEQLKELSSFQAIGTGWGKSFIEMISGTTLGGVICVVPDDNLRQQLVVDFKGKIKDSYKDSAQDPIFTLKSDSAPVVKKYAAYQKELDEIKGDDIKGLEKLVDELMKEIKNMELSAAVKNEKIKIRLESMSLKLKTIKQVIEGHKLFVHSGRVTVSPGVIVVQQSKKLKDIMQHMQNYEKDLLKDLLKEKNQIAIDELKFSLDEIRRIAEEGSVDEKLSLKSYIESNPYLVLTHEELKALGPLLDNQIILIDEMHELGDKDHIGFLTKLSKRNVLYGLTGTPTLEMYRKLKCSYDATVVQAMKAGYLRSVITEKGRDGKDYQVQGTKEEVLKSAAINYFGTRIYHRYGTKGYGSVKIWTDVRELHQEGSDKKIAVDNAIKKNCQEMYLETNMIFNSNEDAQEVIKNHYQSLLGVDAKPDLELIKAIQERRIILEALERQRLYAMLGEEKTIEALRSECQDYLLTPEEYYTKVIQPEIMQGRITQLSNGVSAKAMSLLFAGEPMEKASVAANNGMFGVFMHKMLKDHIVNLEKQPPEIKNHYEKLFEELKDLPAYKKKIEQQLRESLPWDDEKKRTTYINLVLCEIEKIAKLMQKDPSVLSSLDPSTIETAKVSQEAVHTFDDRYALIVNQKSTSDYAQKTLAEMDLGVTTHIISDKTFATGISKKNLLNVNICITDPNDELLHPARIAQAAGRCIRDDAKQGFCKQVVSSEVEAKFAAHEGQPFTPAQAFGEQFSEDFNGALELAAKMSEQPNQDQMSRKLSPMS